MQDSGAPPKPDEHAFPVMDVGKVAALIFLNTIDCLYNWARERAKTGNRKRYREHTEQKKPRHERILAA